MIFYKLIGSDHSYIGVASSIDFVRYNRISGYFLTAGEVDGQFINVYAHLYRDTWMCMLPDNFNIAYEQVQVIEITEEEYTTLHNLELQAQQDEEFIPNYEPYIPQDEEPPVIIYESDIISEQTLIALKRLKITALSKDCNATIENGFDLEIQGETQHFSLTMQDQLNLMNLSTLAQTQELIPYHADGETCVFYTSEEINEIVNAANEFKIYHTTYYNALKTYVNSLETMEEVTAIEYGVKIPDKYKSDVLKILEQ